MGNTAPFFRFEGHPYSYRQGRGERENREAGKFNDAMKEFLGGNINEPNKRARRVSEHYLQICRESFCGQVAYLLRTNPRIEAARRIQEYFQNQK